MDKYIEQLLGDIREASSRTPFTNDADILPREDHFAEDMFKLETRETEDDTIEKYVGILLENLPSEEKIKHHHLEKLVPALEELLISFRVFPEYPEPTPLKIRYHLLREIWQEPQWMLRSGGLHLDFCIGYCEGCQVLEYCSTGQEIENDQSILISAEEEPETSRDTREDLLSGNPGQNFIAGIYNYCNRWCERCHFAARCRLRAEEIKDELEFGEVEDRLEAVRRSMEKSMQMLDKMAEEAGIQLDDIPDDEYRRNREEATVKMQEHELFRISKHYGMEAIQWLRSDGIRQLEEESGACREELKVIHWYKLFIHVKIARGLRQKYGQSSDQEYKVYDANGSVKLAIIGLEESLQSWKTLIEIIPQEQDEILDFINLASGIKEKLMTEFPDAMSFIRPGFDEEQGMD